jgi:hypothetical protein
VVRDRPEQQNGRQGGQRDARDVEVTLSAAQAAEPDREGKRQQEPEQHLHAKPDHAELLDQLKEVAVIPLRPGFRA